MEGGAEAVPHCSVGIIGVLDIMYVPCRIFLPADAHHTNYEIQSDTNTHRAAMLNHGDKCRRKQMLGKGWRGRPQPLLEFPD